MDRITHPTLLLDKEKLLGNIENMRRKASVHQIELRPHFKTHQSAGVAHLFRSFGIHKATVSSLAMAQYFIHHGWDDLTVAIPHNPRETSFVNHAFSPGVRLNLLVDHPDTIEHLNQTLDHPLDAWIKIDCGQHRCGLTWDDEARAASLVQSLKRGSKLRLHGLLTHAGHSYTVQTPAEVLTVHEEQLRRMTHARDLFAALGCKDLLTSIGDTPCATLADTFSPVDEIRPGNFVFFDLDQLFRQVCSWQDIAVALACPVIGTYPDRRQLVIHGGAVHLSKEQRRGPSGTSFGKPVLLDTRGWSEPLDADLTALTQEHGTITFHKMLDPSIKIGSLIGILPIHSCLTADLFPAYLCLDGNRLTKMRANE
jgi:D-serine deaminase-like pyridoxal phosphate-dependent protein